MSILKRLFGGGGSEPEAAPDEYKGFAIHPDPEPDGNRFRLAARIEKEVAGEVKSYRLIRADVFDAREAAAAAALAKARQVIDEQGDAIFGR